MSMSCWRIQIEKQGRGARIDLPTMTEKGESSAASSSFFWRARVLAAAFSSAMGSGAGWAGGWAAGSTALGAAGRSGAATMPGPIRRQGLVRLLLAGL